MGKITAAQRRDMMLNQPVHQAIPRLAVPTIITMLITSIYNMADTYFVSQINTQAAGAVGVVFSAMSIIQALAFTIGMGTGTNMSRLLGAGKTEQASRFAATAFFTAIGVGLVCTILGMSNIGALVRLLGATETIAPYAIDYATYIFYAAPFMMGSLVMNNMLRFQGMALFSMVGIGFGGILNMALDPLLIFGLNLGTAGAAIATAISQMTSFIILLIMSNKQESCISIRLKNYTPSLSIYKRILYNGVPSLGRQGIASISTILLNRAAGVYGDAAIAGISIVTRYVMFANSAVIGFGQGFQPLCGFCYGAGKYKRLREALFFCIKVATTFLLVMGVVSFIFAQPIIGLFRRDDLQVIAVGAFTLRAHLCTVPLWGVITMSNMFTQSIGYGVRSLLIASARQGLFLIPLILFLPAKMGLIGLQIAQPIADALTFVLALAVVSGILKKFRSMPDEAAENKAE